MIEKILMMLPFVKRRVAKIEDEMYAKWLTKINRLYDQVSRLDDHCMYRKEVQLSDLISHRIDEFVSGEEFSKFLLENKDTLYNMRYDDYCRLKNNFGSEFQRELFDRILNDLNITISNRYQVSSKTFDPDIGIETTVSQIESLVIHEKKFYRTEEI